MAPKTNRLTVTAFNYGNLVINVAVDTDDTVYITTPTIESILNYRENSTREKIASKSFKDFVGKEFKLGKKLLTIENDRGFVNGYSLSTFTALATWEATVNGNLEVGKLLALGFQDSVESLVYEAFGIEVNAELRQARLKLREINKKQFHPLFTAWLKADADGDSSKVNWAKEVNRFKLCGKLPLKPVTEYNFDEIQQMNHVETVYNTCRKLGLSHEDALTHL